MVKVFWDRLGLTSVIQAALGQRGVEVDVPLCTLAMVINRLVDPLSKLAAHEWLSRIYLPELEPGIPPLHHLYRSLDYLVQAKERLEEAIYRQITDLLSLRLNLVFYDLTSTYFEGGQCSLAQYGYSRDHRPDRKQVTIGLLVTPEGLPIAHEVFSGNTLDKTTVPDMVKRLQERFDIQSCIFVGDRGMVTVENIRLLEQAGYSYVIGYHKRGRVLSDDLLARHTDLTEYTKGENGLYYKEVELQPGPEDGSVPGPTLRAIICHNSEKAEDDRLFRETALAEAEEELAQLQQRLGRQAQHRGRKFTPKGVMLRVAEILNHKQVANFFTVEYDGGENLTFARNEPAIVQEALRDGKFLVQTNAELSAWQVVQAYKTLQKVEGAFRELKDFLRVRPVYHWNPDRVKGHIFVCVLAYLFEQWMEVLYGRYIEAQMAQARRLPDPAVREAELVRLRKNRLSGRRILDLLSEIQATAQAFVGKPFYAVTGPNPHVTHLLKILDVPTTPRLLPR